MPYELTWVEPEVVLTHNGVTIYHTYKNDEVDQGQMQFWFTTDGFSDVDEFKFDVRDLPAKSNPEETLRHAIDAGILKQPEYA